MIERERDTNTFEVACDKCPEATSIDTDGDWNAMIAELKEAGWSILRDDEGWWEHFCPACAEDPLRGFPA